MIKNGVFLTLVGEGGSIKNEKKVNLSCWDRVTIPAPQRPRIPKIPTL